MRAERTHGTLEGFDVFVDVNVQNMPIIHKSIIGLILKAMEIPVMEFQVWGYKARGGLLYETAKISSKPVTGLCNRGPLKIPNGIKLILDDLRNHLDSYTISLGSFRSFCKPVTGSELFFAFFLQQTGSS